MPDMHSAPQDQLPSSAQLLRSTMIAAAVALVLLVTVVLPAEYGVDPTGVGRVLGLTEMGEIKVSLAKEAAAADSIEAAARNAGTGSTSAPVAAASAATVPAAPSAAQPSAASGKSDVTELVLQPNQGAEIKLEMRKDAQVNFSWSVAGGVVNFDTHADAPGISYHGYEKGSAQRSDDGVLTAAFDGSHGWFFRNRGRETVTVTLRTDGAYQGLKRM